MMVDRGEVDIIQNQIESDPNADLLHCVSRIGIDLYRLRRVLGTTTPGETVEVSVPYGPQSTETARVVSGSDEEAEITLQGSDGAAYVVMYQKAERPTLLTQQRGSDGEVLETPVGATSEGISTALFVLDVLRLAHGMYENPWHEE